MRTRGHVGESGHHARHRLDAPALPSALTPLPGEQQMAAAEHIERQIAVGVVITVEEPPFLVPCSGRSVASRSSTISRGARACAARKKIDQERVDLWPVAVDPVILGGVACGRVLQTIERALAGQRLTIRPQHRMQLADQHPEGRVLAQLVVVVEVLVAEHQPEDALSHQCLAPGAPRSADRAVGEATANRRISPSPRSTCRNSSAPAFDVMCRRQTSHHRPPFNRFKREQCRATLCRHRGHPGF